VKVDNHDLSKKLKQKSSLGGGPQATPKVGPRLGVSQGTPKTFFFFLKKIKIKIKFFFFFLKKFN
jgi:hypothetical protein